MHSKIVFITSHHLYKPTMEVLARIGSDFDTDVVAYDNFEHIAKVYNQYAQTADAFLVSGPSAKRAIELGCGSCRKPIISFQVGADALYRDILRMVADHPQQDLRRVAMDFLLPLNCGYSVADFLEIDDVDSVDTMIREWMSRTGIQEVGGAENAIMARILALWGKKEIDLVICQYSSIVPALDALGIPYRCPFLSDTHLKSLLHDVEARIELQQLQDNLPAIIQIVPEHPDPNKIDTLQTYARRFAQENLIDCVEQKSETALFLITTMEVLRFLTDDFRICRLSAYLAPLLDFPIAIGYGIGATVSHAMGNVQIAVREARITGKNFVMDSSGNLIGPLNSENRMVVSTNSVADISFLSKRCKLSTLTLQKLMAHIQATGSDKITTQELAQRFDISIRNANRILTNLCKGGVATPVYTQISHSRGRPTQVYYIDFSID